MRLLSLPLLGPHHERRAALLLLLLQLLLVGCLLSSSCLLAAAEGPPEQQQEKQKKQQQQQRIPPSPRSSPGHDFTTLDDVEGEPLSPGHRLKPSPVAAATAAAATTAAAVQVAAAGIDNTPPIPRERLLSKLKPLQFRTAQQQQQHQQQQQQQQRRLRSAWSVGLVGSRLRRSLRWRREGGGQQQEQQQQQQAGEAPWSLGSGMALDSLGLDYAADLEGEEEVSEKCLAAFRGDALTHKADPIGRSGPRSLRLLSCQLEFPRDGGRQRDDSSSLTLRGVAVSAPPANIYREHRLSGGALVILVSCPACPQSAVSFYIRRAAAPIELSPPPAAAAAAGAAAAAAAENPGCGVDFAIGELGTTYKAVGVAKPWMRQAVVCSGNATHFAAITKPKDLSRLVEAMASQLATPLISDVEVEKAFIAAASSFNAHLLSGQPRAVAMHLALKCGVGEMAKVHFGTWRNLRGWAERQELSVQDAVRHYHEQAYLPGRLAVAIVDRRPMSDLEAAVGSSLSLLAGRIGETAAAPPAAAPAPAAAAVKTRATTSASCSTPAVHYVESMADQQHPRVFFSFFLPAVELEATSPITASATGAATTAAATAAAVAARLREEELSLALRARRFLVAMLSATARGSLIARLRSSGLAQQAAVHLPISNDSGAVLQVEVVLTYANFNEKVADAGEMIFAFIASAAAAAAAAVIAAAAAVIAAAAAVVHAAHQSDLGTVEERDLKAAAAAGVVLLQQLSPSRLHLVLQSSALDSACSRLQPQTLARHGSGKMDAAVYSRWLAAFRSRKQALKNLLSRWGLALPSQNPFASWARQDQAVSLRWQEEELPESSSSNSHRVRRSDTVVVSVAGPWEALESVLLALLLPLSPSPAAALASASPATAEAARGAAAAEITHAAVAAANSRLMDALQEVPRPGLLLTETALDLLVEPQKTREGLSRELRRARVEEQLVVAWRDSLWKRMALQATIEGNIPEAAAHSIISLVISVLKPVELVDVSEAVPSKVVDLRGIEALSPSTGAPRSFGRKDERGLRATPPTALYIHPAFSATAFHAVRVYVQLGSLGGVSSDIAAATAAAAAAAAGAAAGDWFAAAVSLRLYKESSSGFSAAKPPYFLTIGGIGYLSCTVTSSLNLQTLLAAVDAAVRSLARLSVEEALREVELAPEWSPRRRDRHLCPFSGACPEHVNSSAFTAAAAAVKAATSTADAVAVNAAIFTAAAAVTAGSTTAAEQPLLEWGIEMSLRALRETPRLLVGSMHVALLPPLPPFLPHSLNEGSLRTELRCFSRGIQLQGQELSAPSLSDQARALHLSTAAAAVTLAAQHQQQQQQQQEQQQKVGRSRGQERERPPPALPPKGSSFTEAAR
ncbi:hypothetical protein Emed_006177 [Eimeria media]